MTYRTRRGSAHPTVSRAVVYFPAVLAVLVIWLEPTFLHP